MAQEEKYPGIIDDIEKIMEENTSGDPMSFLKWTNESTYKIADELRTLEHKIDTDTLVSYNPPFPQLTSLS